MAIDSSIPNPYGGGWVDKSFPTLRGIPYWDQAALEGVPNLPRQQLDALNVTPINVTAPGIITALPESPDEPWPRELSPWDTIKLAGMRAPGVARVEGGRGRRVPAMIVPGATGAIPTFLGEDAVEFTIRLTIWTPKQWKWLQDFVGLIMPPPTALIKPVSVKVDYPGLALLHIFDIYIIRVAIPVPDDKQIGRIEIHCTEFLPFLDTGIGPVGVGTNYTKDAAGHIFVSPKPPVPSPLVNSLGPNGR